MRFRSYIIAGLAFSTLSIVSVSCGNNKKAAEDKSENTTRGNISISVDESYMPVLEQQLNVFDSSYPEAHVKAAYKTEKQCFEDLYTDSARLIVVSRDLTAAERTVYEHNKVKVKSLGVAMDAIAVIVNPSSPDSFMTVGQLKQILMGKFARTYTIVFDNAQSGTVRYMLDSLIPGQQLSSKTYAIKNTDSLIDYVSKNENAIGFLSVSQAYDPESTVPERNEHYHIENSSGATLNLTANMGYSIGRLLFQASAAAPLIVRRSRPDGLTRSWIISGAVGFRF